MNRHFTTLALMLITASVACFAEEADWKNVYIKGGFASPQGDSRDMTNKSKGFTFEAGYIVTPTSWEGEVHFYVGYVKMGGDANYDSWLRGYDPNGNIVKISNAAYQALPTATQANYTILEQKFTYDMTGHTYGVDFVFPFKVCDKNITVFTGPSLHQWYMVQLNPKMPIMERNLKTGWRLGTTYRQNEHLEYSVAYTQTEWRSSSTQPFEQGANPSRPAYLSLTASYRF